MGPLGFALGLEEALDAVPDDEEDGVAWNVWYLDDGTISGHSFISVATRLPYPAASGGRFFPAMLKPCCALWTDWHWHYKRSD